MDMLAQAFSLFVYQDLERSQGLALGIADSAAMLIADVKLSARESRLSCVMTSGMWTFLVSFCIANANFFQSAFL